MENENTPIIRQIQSLDVLRGFDMLWIIGGGSIFVGLGTLTNWLLFNGVQISIVTCPGMDSIFMT